MQAIDWILLAVATFVIGWSHVIMFRKRQPTFLSRILYMIGVVVVYALEVHLFGLFLDQLIWRILLAIPLAPVAALLISRITFFITGLALRRSS